MLVRLGAPIDDLAIPLWFLVHPDLKNVPRVRAVGDFFISRILGERELIEGRGG